MFALSILLGIIFFLWLSLKIILEKRKFGALEEKYGHPKPLSIFAQISQGLNLREMIYTLPKMIRNRSSKSSFFWYLSYPTFYTQNPEFMEQIFLSSNCNVKSDMYYMFNKEVGAGLVTIGGTKWERHRKALNPSFSHRILMSLFPNFNERSNAFVQDLDCAIGKVEFDMYSFVQSFTIKTSLETLMNVRIQDDDKRSKDFIMHSCRFWKLLLERIVIVPWQYDLFFYQSKLYKPYTESKQYVMDYMRNLLNNKIDSQEFKQHQANEDSINIQKSNRIFIEQVVDVYQKDILCWDEAYHNLLVTFFASFDTSATTIFSTLFFLATHPQYQEKLFEEVATFYPNKVFEVKYEDLKDLVYMDMVINETLRLAPAAPITGRIVTKDMKLANDLILPKGTVVVLDIINMQRNEDIWGPNANQFNPDNFIPDNFKAKHPYCFVPFVKGSRMCIGWRYAEFFLKTTLAKLVRNYRFTTTFPFEDVRFVVGITLDYIVKPSIQLHRR